MNPETDFCNHNQSEYGDSSALLLMDTACRTTAG